MAATDERRRDPEPTALERLLEIVPLERPGEAEAEGPRKKEHPPLIREVPVLVLISLVVALVVKSFLVQAFFIPSSSMEPTLLPGDRVLVNKLAYRFGDVGRGDVVVFENPDPALQPDRSILGSFVHWLGEGLGFAQPEDEDLIKRVIGVAGDTVEIRDRTAYVNGEALAEPYLTPDARAAMGDYGPVTVPEGMLFVLGDNRGNSADSRAIGFVPEDRVVGRAFVIIWPPSDLGGLG